MRSLNKLGLLQSQNFRASLVRTEMVDAFDALDAFHAFHGKNNSTIMRTKEEENSILSRAKGHVSTWKLSATNVRRGDGVDYLGNIVNQPP